MRHLINELRKSSLVSSVKSEEIRYSAETRVAVKAEFLSVFGFRNADSGPHTTLLWTKCHQLFRAPYYLHRILSLVFCQASKLTDNNFLFNYVQGKLARVAIRPGFISVSVVYLPGGPKKAVPRF